MFKIEKYENNIKTLSTLIIFDLIIRLILRLLSFVNKKSFKTKREKKCIIVFGNEYCELSLFDELELNKRNSIFLFIMLMILTFKNVNISGLIKRIKSEFKKKSKNFSF